MRSVIINPVQVCNTGFIPDKVNFAMRIARNGGGTQARACVQHT